MGAHRSVLVKALCYKPEGRGFETRWVGWIFSIYLILPGALGPVIYSASSRNEYQKKLRGLSPWANYTDRETTDCRRSKCQLLQIESGQLRTYSRPSRPEISIRSRRIMFLVIRERPVHRADNLLPPYVSQMSIYCWIFNISQPHRPPRPNIGIALLYGDGVRFLRGTNLTVSTATSSQYLAVNCEPIV
jgi:hypothetical protein